MSNLTIETLEGVKEIPAADWDRLVGGESPFLEHGFLAGLEQAGCLTPESGWYPMILIAREDERLVGAAPLYLKEHSAGEFVFDWAWADGAYRAGIPYYPKAVVAVPFTPVTGTRILVDPERGDAKAIGTALIEACLNLADRLDLSSLHFNFLRPQDLATFRDQDLPLRLGLQYHWKNDDGTGTPYTDFDHFLARFRSKARANIRRERRKLAESGVTTRVASGTELSSEEITFLFDCYRDTVQKFYYGRQYLNEDFFQALHKERPERLHAVFVEQEGQAFGATFNLLKDHHLYGRYWGAREDVPFAHFEPCIYRPVEWAITEGIQTFEPGAGGDHKYDRGFTPTLTYSAHYIRHPALRDAVHRFIDDEARRVEATRDQLIKDGPLKV